MRRALLCLCAALLLVAACGKYGHPVRRPPADRGASDAQMTQLPQVRVPA